MNFKTRCKVYAGIVTFLILCFVFTSVGARGIWFMPNENKGSFQLKTLRVKEIRAPQATGTHVTTIYSPTLSGTMTATGATISSPTISNPTISGTITGTGVVSATNIANPTRSFALPLAGAAIDGGDDIDDASAPDITTLDNVPSILWDDSGETAAVQWTFRLPSDFVSGLVVYALVSSNDASGSGTILDWAVAVNTDDTGFASPTAQTQVACTSATLNASNEVLTLTSDATAEALYSAGTWITLELFNASTNDDDLELKGVDVTYTATM